MDVDGGADGYSTDKTVAESDDSDGPDEEAPPISKKATFSLEHLMDESPEKVRIAEFSDSCAPVPRRVQRPRVPPPRPQSEWPIRHEVRIPI